jgi:hypothetical protein
MTAINGFMTGGIEEEGIVKLHAPMGGAHAGQFRI